MRVALISDVHANLPALQVVLDDAQARGVDAVWNLGDFVGYGPFPDEVVRLSKKRADLAVIGNYDLKVLEFADKARQFRKKKAPLKYLAFRFAHDALSKSARTYLSSLPGQQRVELGPFRVLLVHGSPTANDEPLTENTSEQRLEALAEQAQADVVVCGHTHRFMDRRAGGARFVNPGSVGRPESSDRRASYAILDQQGEQLAVEHRLLDYPVEPLILAIRENHLPEPFEKVFLTGSKLPNRQSEEDWLNDDDLDEPRFEPERQWREVLAFCARTYYEKGHADQVRRLSLRLFDELQAVHGLGQTERFYIQCGAQLHDIGWQDGQKGHHKASLSRIVAADQLPFTLGQRVVLGLIARYHRKALPSDGHDLYAALSSTQQRWVCLMAGMVRLADGLDRTHTNAVADLTCQIGDGRILVSCAGSKDMAAEITVGQEKSDLLARTLGYTICIQVANDRSRIGVEHA